MAITSRYLKKLRDQKLLEKFGEGYCLKKSCTVDEYKKAYIKAKKELEIDEIDQMEIQFRGIKVNPLNAPPDRVDGYDFSNVERELLKIEELNGNDLSLT